MTGMSSIEDFLNLCGYEIWPTHNGPCIKDPQPRIIIKRQWEAMEEQRHSASGE